MNMMARRVDEAREKLRLAAIVQDTLHWRFVGAAAWHFSIIASVTGVYLATILLIGNTEGALNLLGFRGLLLLLTQVAVLAAHRSVLSSSEAPPFNAPKLGIHRGSWISHLIARTLLRGRKLSDTMAVLYLYASTAMCGALYSFLNPPLLCSQHSSLQWSTAYGGITALVYLMLHLARCKDVLSYPSVQRHRYYQIKSKIHESKRKLGAGGRWGEALTVAGGIFTHSSRLPLPSSSPMYPLKNDPFLPVDILSVLSMAFKVAFACLLLLLLFGRLKTPGPLQWLSSGISMTLCILGWRLGAVMLNIVYTEQTRLQALCSEAPLSSLVAFGLSSDDGLIQDMTLMQLAGVTEEQSAIAFAGRQALAFADETGRTGWVPVGSFLIGEIRDMTLALAAALTPPKGGSGGNTVSGSAVGFGASRHWNSLSLGGAAGGSSSVGRSEQDVASWTIRSRFYRIRWCLRSLSALAAASRSEDRYGVLLLSEPNLAEVMVTMGSAVLALQQYTKTMASQANNNLWTRGYYLRCAVSFLAGPVHPTQVQVETLSFALEDMARGCTYKMILAFGASFKAALAEVKQKPTYGSMAEVSALLQAMMDGQE